MYEGILWKNLEEETNIYWMLTMIQAQCWVIEFTRQIFQLIAKEANVQIVLSDIVPEHNI